MLTGVLLFADAKNRSPLYSTPHVTLSLPRFVKTTWWSHMPVSALANVLLEWTRSACIQVMRQPVQGISTSMRSKLAVLLLIMLGDVVTR